MPPASSRASRLRVRRRAAPATRRPRRQRRPSPPGRTVRPPAPCGRCRPGEWVSRSKWTPSASVSIEVTATGRALHHRRVVAGPADHSRARARPARRGSPGSDRARPRLQSAPVTRPTLLERAGEAASGVSSLGSGNPRRKALLQYGIAALIFGFLIFFVAQAVEPAAGLRLAFRAGLAGALRGLRGRLLRDPGRAVARDRRIARRAHRPAAGQGCVGEVAARPLRAHERPDAGRADRDGREARGAKARDARERGVRAGARVRDGGDGGRLLRDRAARPPGPVGAVRGARGGARSC